MRSLWQVHPAAAPTDMLALTLDRLERSGLVGESQLKGTFRGSRGFGIAFRADGLARVRERFAALIPFLDLLSLGNPSRRLRPLGRLRARRPNAFYLNLLIVGDGAGVGHHVDGTLGDPAGVPGSTPDVVTALYLQVPNTGSGGELVLHRGSLVLAELLPAPGQLVHFRGDLAHQIRPLAGANQPRVSLICEQYWFEPPVLDRLSAISLQSRATDPTFAPRPGPKASFQDHLRHRAGRRH